ncbi:hypothetical protein BDW74DRAFT_161215 [Aspergillus multicolor]|uniref:uncharacterized protein n=1 Tax=Aspergillus multicolor TaxID=41759 RepID=UPI003CCDC9DA
MMGHKSHKIHHPQPLNLSTSACFNCPSNVRAPVPSGTGTGRRGQPQAALGFGMVHAYAVFDRRKVVRETREVVGYIERPEDLLQHGVAENSSVGCFYRGRGQQYKLRGAKWIGG